MSKEKEDIKEFKRTYDRFADPIFRFIYVRLSDRERSLEISQDVFMRYWNYVKAGNSVQNTQAFLYRSAINAFSNEIRNKLQISSLEQMEEKGFEPVEERKDIQINAEQREIITKMGQLEPEDRMLLILRYVEDLRVKDISEIMNISENTASVKIKRATEKLKKIYGERN